MDSKVVKEIKKGERTYHFILYPDSPVGEALDVVIELWQWLAKINEDALNKAKESLAKPPEQPIQE